MGRADRHFAAYLTCNIRTSLVFLTRSQGLGSTADTALEDWFEGPLGARVLREEAALATLALDTVFGFELLQGGAWGPARHLLTGARTQHATRLPPELTTAPTLSAPLDSLPFRSDPVDPILCRN